MYSVINSLKRVYSTFTFYSYLSFSRFLSNDKALQMAQSACQCTQQRMKSRLNVSKLAFLQYEHAQMANSVVLVQHQFHQQFY